MVNVFNSSQKTHQYIQQRLSRERQQIKKLSSKKKCALQNHVYSNNIKLKVIHPEN